MTCVTAIPSAKSPSRVLTLATTDGGLFSEGMKPKTTNDHDAIHNYGEIPPVPGATANAICFQQRYATAFQLPRDNRFSPRRAICQQSPTPVS
jgi:hypothetical protein